jgi:hypothetical protein
MEELMVYLVIANFALGMSVIISPLKWLACCDSPEQRQQVLTQGFPSIHEIQSTK